MVSRPNRATLDALIAEATVNCYTESECVTGFYTMLEDNLATPFQTMVLGVDVTVTGLDLTDDEQITAVCRRGRSTQRIRSWTCRCPVNARRARNGSTPTADG